MSYRKIVVNDKEYLYTIGKTHVKIRGIEAIPKEQIGELYPVRCECCQLTLEEIYGYEHNTFQVHPKHIANYIKETTT